MSDFHLFVPGEPIPQGSTRAFMHNGKPKVTNQTPKLRKYRRELVKALKDAGAPFFDGPLAVNLVFYLDRPKSHYGTGKNADKRKDSSPYHHLTRPDLDKLARSVLDALTGTVVKDDSQVVTIVCHKRYGAAGTQITLSDRTVSTGKTIQKERTFG